MVVFAGRPFAKNVKTNLPGNTASDQLERGASVQYDMNAHERNIELHLRILARIEQHDVKNPIKIKALAAEFCINERQVKRILLLLIDGGHKIGSSKVEPMGVFKAQHPSEVYATAQRMKNEGLKYLSRARKLLDWGGAQPTVFEQDFEIPKEIGEIANA